MTFEQEFRYEQIRKELDKQFTDMDYRNIIVAKRIAKGEKEITEDWVRNGVLQDWKDGFITYGRAVAVFPEYMKAIRRYI